MNARFTPTLSLILATCCFASPAFAADRPKLTAEKWSADINVPDPVACSVDNQGRVFATSTTRRKVGDLDIREWTDWIPDDQALESVDGKRAFFHRALAPGSKPKGPLTDANQDGSIDWRDLMVPTERIYRLVDSNGDGKADQITTFAEDFNTEVTGIAAGVLAFDGSVYATIAPDLWRLQDTNDDGQSDTRESIVHGFGIHIAYAGHDMHGLRVGPDGRIYWSIGDKGVNVTTQDGKQFFYPNEGAVLRCEPDGSKFEVFAHGLRNVQETAFNEFGDLFGVDNDADKPGEKERLVFITEGSDSGWRCGFQYMGSDWCPWMDEGRWQPENPAQPFFITPPIANSHDGPAGFVYNPGTALAEGWRGWFFLDQFPSGKMNALRLEPDGAAWKLAEDVPVSTGIMGIGMSWGPDGRLFFADWAGGYPLNQKGAIWALDVPEADRDPMREEVRTRLHEGFSKLKEPQLRKLLGHADVRLREGAQFQLARTGQWKTLRNVALDTKTPLLARLHAIWGLGQGLRWEKWADSTTLQKLCADSESEVRAQTAKIIAEGPEDAALASAVIKLISDPQPRARFQAALAAGRMKLPSATEPLLSAAKAHGDGDPWMRHAIVTGLAGCASPAELTRAAKDGDASLRRACLLALARQRSTDVTAFLDDPDPRLAAEAALAIYDDLGIPDALPHLAEWLAKAPADATEGALRRAANANLRLGTPEAAARVAAFALDKKANEKVRSAALAALATWNTPPVLDRVDGRARVLAARPLDPLREALQGTVGTFLALEEPALRAAALEMIMKLGLPVPAERAASIVSDASVPTPVRVEALRLLATQNSDVVALRTQLERWLDASAKGEPPALRAEALRTLAKVDPPRALAAAQALLKKGTVEEQQAAWSVLGAVALPEADKVITNAIENFEQVPPATQLDLLTAAANRASESFPIANAIAKLDASRPAYRLLDPFYPCLEGGDPKAGREVVLTNISANCTACHRFEGAAGSDVGPPLDGIGSRATRLQLLESLIEPGTTVVPGYGVTSIRRKNGELVTGTNLGEEGDKVRLKQPDGTVIEIDRQDIAKQSKPLSPMPPMANILSRNQIRDVIAYLASLKIPETAKEKK